MDSLSTQVVVIFTLALLFSMYIFLYAANSSKTALLVLLPLFAIQSILGINGFYQNTSTLPPRFGLLLIPALVLMVAAFTTNKGKDFVSSLSLGTLCLLHVVRIPVEIALFLLYKEGYVPELMTFEGRNFDILAGLSAPVIYFLGFYKKTLSNKVIIGWNIICLFLVVNIVVHGILSAPSPLQQFAFEQPNRAVLYFPFNLLPGIIVPLVIFSHISTIVRLKDRMHAS